MVALVFFALRDVYISVGTWTCERLKGEPRQAFGDVEQKWPFSSSVGFKDVFSSTWKPEGLDGTDGIIFVT